MSVFIPTAAAGNGYSLATFGRTGEIMGFFYPRIDFAKNVAEGMPAFRLLESDDSESFVWSFTDCWRVAQSFEPASNVLITRLAHREIDLNVEFSDVLPPCEHALLRRIVICKGKQVGPVQFMHYFRLAVGDSLTRNGVHVYPQLNLVVQHYRDIAVALSSSTPFVADCGTWHPDHESPTKQAMRSGDLGQSLHAIGRVDFAIAFEPITDNRWEAVLVLAGSATREAAMSTSKRLAVMPFPEAVQAANEKVAKELEGAGLSAIPEIADAFERAVISLHDLYDEFGGTFIAAPEFDPGYELSGGYGYCWPRDAAVCALVMQKISRPKMARRFFEWSAGTQMPNGHWYQRYWVDGACASSWCVRSEEFQLDQTCSIIHAAGLFARRLGSSAGSFIEFYKPVVERAVHAISSHTDETGLHRPATDLWENCVGVFPYTQAGVIAALREADEVFGIKSDRTGPQMRLQMRHRLFEAFWRADRKCWLRRITPEAEPDETLDSSAIGIIEPWQILDLADPQDRQLAIDTLASISANLRSEVKLGGAILRFENEAYMGGGPGCVNTLWLALCRLRLAQTATDAEERRRHRDLAMEDIRIALANTNPTGQLPELIPKMSFDYWAAPHAWACSLLIEAGLILRSLFVESASEFDAARAQVRRRAPSC
ncbi:MAG: glycoside hydrolase family 15 protein [Planctomycetota bacterium]